MRISDWSSDVCSSDLQLTNDRGGIRDDLMVTNVGDHLFVVVNAACKEADVAHLTAGLPQCEVERLDDRALKIGRASWRGRVCPYVESSVVAVSLQKQQKHVAITNNIRTEKIDK